MAVGIDLLLLNVGGTSKKVYQELSKDYSAIEPPFWAALTAGFIRRKGYDARVIDANAENLTPAETAERIKAYNPKLVDVVVYGQHPSASFQLMSGVRAVCNEIKLLEPQRKIILTGLHPSALPMKTISEEQCDFVCQGEGFYTILGLLDGSNPSNIPGLWWKENDSVRHNPRARNIENLTEELGNVAWGLLPLTSRKYKAHNWQCLDDFSNRPFYASLSTTLGCPFNCNFCSIKETFGERRVRYWKPSWAVDQISHLYHSYGVKVFKIIDEMFILNPQHYGAIADGLIERGIGDKINIWAYARVDSIKEDYLEKMRAAGFKWFCLGFESGDEKILREAHKGKFTRKDMLEIRELIGKYDINIIANYMFGFPNDNVESMQKTLDLALEQNCEFANFYSAMAYPGSQLYFDSINKGVKLPDSWMGYSQHSYECQPLPTNKISAEEVLKFRDDAFEKFFKNSRYLEMIKNKFGAEAMAHIKGMTQIRLRRRLLGD